jgi:tetratricopeptide (TPR) repeat protein
MQRPSRERARTVAAARRGEAGARDRLLALLNDPKETAYWRAVAAGLLDPWVGEPTVIDALLNQTKHADAMVRASATHTLDPLAEQDHPAVVAAMRGLLDDPARSVRVAAAWGLRASVDPDSRAGRELRHMLEFNADQPGGQMQLGAWELARRNPSAALSHYKQAVAWDANSAAIRRELAVVHGMLGQPEESLKQLQEACRLDPNEAEYRYLLGLTWNELGRTDQTIAALREAVRLNPKHARAWYNLGLALNATQQADAAVDALSRAEAADPADPRIPYARATIEASRRRIPEARAAALRALQIQPTFVDAAQLLRSLPPG